jgi:hypothetical protein
MVACRASGLVPVHVVVGSKGAAGGVVEGQRADGAAVQLQRRQQDRLEPRRAAGFAACRGAWQCLSDPVDRRRPDGSNRFMVDPGRVPAEVELGRVVEQEQGDAVNGSILRRRVEIKASTSDARSVRNSGSRSSGTCVRPWARLTPPNVTRTTR